MTLNNVLFITLWSLFW